MPNWVRVAFTNVEDDEEDWEEGTALATKGEKYKGPLWSKCGEIMQQIGVIPSTMQMELCYM